MLNDNSEGAARLLVDSVVDYAIYLLDLQGTVKSWNAGAQRIKGYSAQEIIGTNFSVFYPDEAIQRGEPARALEVCAVGRQIRGTGLAPSKRWNAHVGRCRHRSGAQLGTNRE